MDVEYTRRLEKIEAVLERWLPEGPDAAWAGRVFPGLEGRVPENCLASLAGPCRDLLSRGGKRWRPLLMVLVCESLGGGQAALPLVPLVEFCHNASLIHDDIEDGSDRRRGKPAVHLIHGLDTAINSGSFFYFLPLSCLGAWEAPAEQKEAVFAVWGEYMRRLHLGQAMDIHWHRNFESLPSLDEYYTMCGLKTGCLARLAAVLGVLSAIPGGEAGERARRDRAVLALGEAAEKLGIGFQILDDVKNLSTGLPGKRRGDDVVEGKKSLPVLLYLHGAGKNAGASRRSFEERGELAARCFTGARKGGPSAPEVEELIAQLDAAGTLEQARERGLALIREAVAVLSGDSAAFAPGGEGRRLLGGLADLIS
ncbi:MAG: polyprenyl synthetase family protein [Treponema sp.]|jgi:octaprenyl-diphosphate synthase|nr:polyprenyl synthetase family protein [Treponema sp.]